MTRQNYLALLVILLINFITLFAITFNLVNYALELFVSILLLIAAVGLVYSFYMGKPYSRKFALLFFAANLINIAFLFTVIPTSLLIQGLVVLVINIIGFSYSVNVESSKRPRPQQVELPSLTRHIVEEPSNSEVYTQFTRPAARVVKPAKKKKAKKKAAKKSQRQKVSGKLKKPKAFSTKIAKKKK